MKDEEVFKSTVTLSQLFDKLNYIDSKMEDHFGSLRTEIASLRYELKDEIEGVKNTIKDMEKSIEAARDSIGDIKEEMKANEELERSLKDQLQGNVERNGEIHGFFPYVHCHVSFSYALHVLARLRLAILCMYVCGMCGNCNVALLQNISECYCCCELEGCEESIKSDLILQDLAPDVKLTCITEHPGFQPVCLQKWSLRLAAGKFKTKRKERYRQTGREER